MSDSLPMRVLTLCLLALLLFSGCGQNACIQVSKPENGLVQSESYTEAATTATTVAAEARTITDAAEIITPADNPYSGGGEAADDWRYGLYEIFRGAQMLSLDGALEYSNDYEHLVTLEGYPDILHTYTCQITLPQSEEDEPWVQALNSYYQGLMPELVAEGDSVWEANIDDWYVSGLRYYVEGAYRVGQIITVVRSCFFHDWRPSAGWNPFADIFSALDGKKLVLDDLFSVPREEWLSVVEAGLSAAGNRFYEGYMPEYGDYHRSLYGNAAISYMDEASVAVTPVGLVFIYPVGYASAMAAGTVFLDIPFESLKGLLNPIYFPNNQ